jgi:hypothetical protein
MAWTREAKNVDARFQPVWEDRRLIVVCPDSPWTLEFGDLEGSGRRWVLTHRDEKPWVARLLPWRRVTTVEDLERDIGAFAPDDVASALVDRVLRSQAAALFDKDGGRTSTHRTTARWAYGPEPWFLEKATPTKRTFGRERSSRRRELVPVALRRKVRSGAGSS